MKFISHITQFFWILPVFFGLKNYRHLSNNTRVFIIYLVWSLFSEGWAWYLASENINNHFIYKITDYVLLSTTIVMHFMQKKANRLLVVLNMCLCLSLFYSMFSFEEEFGQIGGFHTFFTLGAVCIISLLNLTNVIKHSHPIGLFAGSDFWIFGGLLIYCYSVVTFLCLYKYFGNSNIILNLYQTLYLFLITIVSGVLFTKAMLCKPKVKTY